MQLINMEKKYDVQQLEKMLREENSYITKLFSTIAFPERNSQEEVEPEDTEETENKNSETNKVPKGQALRANSIMELQKRLSQLTSNKKKLSYKDKLQKKNLKNRMKKKSKQDDRNAQAKLKRAEKLTETPEATTTPVKPVFNSEGKMVFSKFDFSGIGKHKKEKKEKDPKKILDNLQKQKEKLEKLEAQGDVEKAAEIKEKTAWKNALAKAQGEKIKDDPELLKKSVKKQEEKQRHSKKKWEKRVEGVKHAQDERQKKRNENIEKRKKDKKVHGLKKAAKRGKIIPGF